MSSTVDFTGNDVIFLYPDGLTALVGQFEKGVMKAAHATEVIGIQKSCHNSNLCPCSNLTLRPRLQSGTKKVKYWVLHVFPIIGKTRFSQKHFPKCIFPGKLGS